ncbi:MAG: MFS transporter [Verrucomicrobia bacterium]|nr:MFS transporter [Verrucomicrobiota bacterium]
MNRKPSVLIIFLTVFIDLVGFGIVVPLVPVYSHHFLADGFVIGGYHFGAEGFLIGGHHFSTQGLIIGVIIASFSAMQFLFSPFWGRLSDRIGRRPVLLISTAGAALSYILFAYSATIVDHTTAILMMILARSFAGACGGNITVAQAYIADITPPDQRSKKMGLIGMAFGLGFIFGPAIGGLSLKHLGGSGPGWIAAGLCAANFILACFVLVESHQPNSEPVAARPHLSQWAHTLGLPKVGRLICIFFITTFCFSCFEATLALLICDNFHLDIRSDVTTATTATYLFVFCGLIGAIVQGGLIGRIVKKMGEPKVIALSLVLTAVSMAFLPFIKLGESAAALPLTWKILFQPAGLPWWLMLAALALLSVGSSLTRPPLFGLLSNLAPANEQGATIGVAQSAGSLARILGPIFATTALFYQPALPYLTATVPKNCGIELKLVGRAVLCPPPVGTRVFRFTRRRARSDAPYLIQTKTPVRRSGRG